MTTDIKLNTLIKWTDEDRAKGKCPVPDGSKVTVWFAGKTPIQTDAPAELEWGQQRLTPITAYLVHSVPREPTVRWMVVGGSSLENNAFKKMAHATELAKSYGGRVVKLVEERE